MNMAARFIHPPKKAGMLFEFREEDFEYFFRWFFFEFGDFMSVLCCRIRFVEYAKLLISKAKTAEAILAIHAVEAKIAVRRAVAVLNERALIEIRRINAFIAKLAID